MFWLETETANLLKTNNRKEKLKSSKVSKVSVPELLEERNKKYQQ